MNAKEQFLRLGGQYGEALRGYLDAHDVVPGICREAIEESLSGLETAESASAEGAMYDMAVLQGMCTVLGIYTWDQMICHVDRGSVV